MKGKKIIENLAFEGGGVLGFAYAGVVQALEEEGILKNVKALAGTSVGAIVSLFLSLDYSSKELQTKINNTDFSDFEDSFNLLPIIKKYGLFEGKAVLKWIQEILTRKGFSKKATFEDLHKAKCRELRVFASDLNLCTLQEFSYRKTPKAIVAEAIRASISLPLFFDAHQFSNKIPNDHLFVDGGLLYEFPITTFKENKRVGLQKTLGFYFLPEVHPKPLKFNQLKSYMHSLFSMVLGFSYKSFGLIEDEEVKQQSIGISQCNVSGYNFKITDKEKEKLKKEGYKKTLAYFNPSKKKNKKSNKSKTKK